MDYLTREDVLGEFQQSFDSLMDTYELDDIGLFEEQGPGDQYYMGYTIRRNNRTYFIHQTFKMNEDGDLTRISDQWVIETDEPNYNDKRGFNNLDSVFDFLY